MKTQEEALMAMKKVKAVRNSATGSYTVPMPKSTATGRFVAERQTQGRIEIRRSSPKQPG